jgi:hypothetical protein
MLRHYDILNQLVLPDLANIIKVYTDPRLLKLREKPKRDPFPSRLIKTLFRIESLERFQSLHYFGFESDHTHKLTSHLKVPHNLATRFKISDQTWKDQLTLPDPERGYDSWSYYCPMQRCAYLALHFDDESVLYMWVLDVENQALLFQGQVLDDRIKDYFPSGKSKFYSDAYPSTMLLVDDRLVFIDDVCEYMHFECFAMEDLQTGDFDSCNCSLLLSRQRAFEFIFDPEKEYVDFDDRYIAV